MAAIYLIRHAQASFGFGDYDNLSRIGLEQAHVLGEAMRMRVANVDAVVAGAMKRHRQTASICLDTMACTTPRIEDDGWNEYDHDELIERAQPRYANKLFMKLDLARTLQPKKAFQRFFIRAVERWVGGEHDADYREPWSAFCVRVEAALARLVARLDREQTAFVFTSGGPITAICAARLALSGCDALRLNWPLVNGGVTKLVSTARGVHVSTFNEHGHFEGERKALLTFR